MAALPGVPATIRGWAVFAHPLFLDQVETLAAQVARPGKAFLADLAKSADYLRKCWASLGPKQANLARVWGLFSAAARADTTSSRCLGQR